MASTVTDLFTALAANTHAEIDRHGEAQLILDHC